MGLNVSLFTGNQLENSDVLRNTAKNILSRNYSPESAQKVIENLWNHSDMQLKESYTQPQLAILKASTQISINESLKETLKYLKTQAIQKAKKEPVLGEIWNVFNANNDATEKNPYKGELYDFEIDKNAKNIFAA